MTISTEGPRGFFGELYLRSTLPFLSPEVTAAETEYLASRLREAGCPGTILDLGCGHGRHAKGLNERLGRRVLGLDLDARSLDEASTTTPVVRGSFFSLPFREAAFGGAYCWYNTLGTFEDGAVPLALAELARCVSPGGWLILQSTPPHVAQRQPIANFDGPLPDGSRLVEEVRYDERARADRLRRELTLPDGRLMAASFFIRYYAVPEWEALLDAAGFLVRWVHGAVDGSAFTEASVDQIVGAQKRG